MSNYRPKYQTAPYTPDYPGKRGVKPKPRDWSNDRHYAYMKHRAQAQFRGEEYTLTELEWNSIWDEHTWMRRGRHPDELSLFRRDPLGPWDITNVVVDRTGNKGAYYSERAKSNFGRPKGSKNK